MEIKTRYEIGQKVWIVYRTGIEIHIYLDKIVEISYNKNSGVLYFTENCQEEIREIEIISEEDIGKLVSRIENFQREIDREEEEKYD